MKPRLSYPIAIITGLIVFIGLALACGICKADIIDDIVPFVIQVESSGRPNAVSKAGAVGLMQITPIVWKEYCFEEGYLDWNEDGSRRPYSSAYYTGSDEQSVGINKMVGTWYLRRLKEHYLKKYIFKLSWLLFPKDFYCETEEDVKLAITLACYNAGPTKMRRLNYNLDKAPKETRDYVRKVMRLYHNSLK